MIRIKDRWIRKEREKEGYEAIKGEMNFNDAQPNKARDGGTISVHDSTLWKGHHLVIWDTN